MRIIYRFYRLAINNKGWKLIAVSLFTVLIFNILLVLLITLFSGLPAEGTKEVSRNFAEDLVIAIIAAPLLETLVFQVIVIRVLRAYIRNMLLVIIISAAIFGLMHYVSPIGVIKSFLLGLAFALIYYIYQRKPAKAYWMTALTHSIWNSIAFFLQTLL